MFLLHRAARFHIYDLLSPQSPPFSGRAFDVIMLLSSSKLNFHPQTTKRQQHRKAVSYVILVSLPTYWSTVPGFSTRAQFPFVGWCWCGFRGRYFSPENYANKYNALGGLGVGSMFSTHGWLRQGSLRRSSENGLIPGWYAVVYQSIFFFEWWIIGMIIPRS